LGLGDGGAHVSLICDAGYPSFLLAYWVRERPGDRLALGQAVQLLTSGPARLYGLHDRGVIAAGRKADLNVIDVDRVGLHWPEVVHDLPAGAKRVIQHADGYAATIVSGQVVQRDGADTGARPGRVIRGH
ncbi:MAG: amidohydrolase family protein, partial [Acidimicrobiales bacterium]